MLLMDTWVASTFWLLWIINIAMNMTIHTSLQDYAFISSGYTPRSGLLDHVVILYLIFSKNHHAAFHNDHTILHFQPKNTSLQTTPCRGNHQGQKNCRGLSHLWLVPNTPAWDFWAVWCPKVAHPEAVMPTLQLGELTPSAEHLGNNLWPTDNIYNLTGFRWSKFHL